MIVQPTIPTPPHSRHCDSRKSTRLLLTENALDFWSILHVPFPSKISIPSWSSTQATSRAPLECQYPIENTRIAMESPEYSDPPSKARIHPEPQMGVRHRTGSRLGWVRCVCVRSGGVSNRLSVGHRSAYRTRIFHPLQLPTTEVLARRSWQGARNLPTLFHLKRRLCLNLRQRLERGKMSSMAMTRTQRRMGCHSSKICRSQSSVHATALGRIPSPTLRNTAGRVCLPD